MTVPRTDVMPGCHCRLMRTWQQGSTWLTTSSRFMRKAKNTIRPGLLPKVCGYMWYDFTLALWWSARLTSTEPSRFSPVAIVVMDCEWWTSLCYYYNYNHLLHSSTCNIDFFHARCELQDCRNRACPVSWLEVIKVLFVLLAGAVFSVFLCLGCMCCFVSFFLVVTISIIDFLERLVSKMTCYVSWDVKPYSLTCFSQVLCIRHVLDIVIVMAVLWTFDVTDCYYRELYMYIRVYCSTAASIVRHQSARCRHVEFCHFVVGACNSWSAFCRIVTYGSWHEGLFWLW